MKNKIWKEIVVTVLLVSTILSFSPVAYGETISVQQSIDAVKMEMKKAAMSYVDPALKGELVPSSSLDSVLNSVKKNYQSTKNIILTSNLSEKEKQAKLKELEALYQEKIVKGLIPYIDAYNYATKYLDPLLKEIKEAEAKNDFLAVEKAYHKISVQLKSRTTILYRFTGKAPRDLLLEKYKKPADNKRDEMMVPVTIIMKLTNAQQLFLAGKKEEAIKAIEDIPSLVAKLSSTNVFHQALIKELERLQAIFFPTSPITPVVPILPVTPPSAGGGGDNNAPSKSNISTIKAVTVNGVAGTVDVSDAKIYNVELPIGTVLANLTAADITAIPTNAKATIGTATTTDGGATWKVVITSENGKSTTTYTITVTPSEMKAEGVTFGAATNTVTGEGVSTGVATVANYLLWTASTNVEVATFNVTDTDGLNQDVSVTLPNTYHDTPDDALAVRTALANDSSINSVYIVSGDSATITLTQRVSTGDLQPVLSIKSISTGNNLKPDKAFAPVTRTPGVSAATGKSNVDEFQVTKVASKAGYLVVRVSDNTGLGNTDVVVNGITTSDTNTQIAGKIASKLAVDPKILVKYNVTSVNDKVFLETKNYGPNAITVSLIN